MVEGGVDHSVRGGHTCAQTFCICNITAMHLCADGGKRFGGRIRTCKTEHLMSRGDQFLDNRRANESSRAGNKDTHEEFLRFDTETIWRFEISG